MKTLIPICVLALTATVSAQATASTLYRLTRTATTIAEVKVLAVQVDRQVRQVVFKTLRSLKGSAPATFSLREADRRMCGSVLHGLVPGTGRIAFLDVAPRGVVLTIPSPRALAPLHQDLRDHVLALLKVGSGSPVQLLTKALATRHPRVRQDAGYALPLVRDLGRADSNDRGRILERLSSVLGNNGKSTASLIRTAQRLRLSPAVETLLPHYLAGRNPGLENLLADAITGIDGAAAARRLQANMPTRPAPQRRAVRLLARCKSREARHCLQQLLTTRNRDVQAQAAAALLEGGHAADDILLRAGREVLHAGRQLLDQRRRRLRFRSIRVGKDD